jgi:hypothetical protein
MSIRIEQSQSEFKNNLVKISNNLEATKTAVSDRLNITPVVSSFTIGNGVDTSFTCEHALGTMDVIVQVYDANTGATVETEAIRVDDQNVSIEFAVAPATDGYKVVTMGIKAFDYSIK